MQRFGVAACEAGLAVALLAACSSGNNVDPLPSTPTVTSPDTATAPSFGPTEATPTTTSSNRPLSVVCPATTTGKKEMYLQNIPEPDADVQLGNVQAKVGIAATKALLGAPNFTFTVGGKTVTPKMQIPENPQARCQVIIFAANSTESGGIFKSLGHPELAASQSSVTNYVVTRNAAGKLAMSDFSVSVVGQETTGAGLFQNISTERCQGLEVGPLSSAPTNPKMYAAYKEAMCNSLGTETDVAMTNGDYEAYLKRIDGKLLDAGINKTGIPITFPVATPAQFQLLRTDLHAAGLTP